MGRCSDYDSQTGNCKLTDSEATGGMSCENSGTGCTLSLEAKKLYKYWYDKGKRDIVLKARGGEVYLIDDDIADQVMDGKAGDDIKINEKPKTSPLSKITTGIGILGILIIIGTFMSVASQATYWDESWWAIPLGIAFIAVPFVIGKKKVRAGSVRMTKSIVSMALIIIGAMLAILGLFSFYIPQIIVGIVMAVVGIFLRK
jgi:hypothetical protein